MPRKKSKNAKRRQEKLKAAAAASPKSSSPGKSAAVLKFSKKLKNIFSKLVKYINEWNAIEHSSQSTFSSLNNLAERLPLLRDLSRETRKVMDNEKNIHNTNNSDYVKKIVNEINEDTANSNSSDNNTIDEATQSFEQISLNDDKLTDTQDKKFKPRKMNIGDSRFGVLNEFPNIGIKLLTRHIQEIERNWRNLRMELDGFHSSTKKMQLLLLQLHDILTAMPYHSFNHNLESINDNEIDGTKINNYGKADNEIDTTMNKILNYVDILERIIQMFLEEYWRKYDLIRNDVINDYSVEAFTIIGTHFNSKTFPESCIQWNYIDDSMSKIMHNPL